MADWLALLEPLWSPGALALQLAVIADLAIGDPIYAWHPVRLVGTMLTWQEKKLRAIGCDGYTGGILLFLGLATAAIGGATAVLVAAHLVSPALAWLVHAFLIYSLLALGDLLRHVWKVETAVRSADLTRARVAVSALVGRDTDRMDGAACRRAAVESLSESLTDGFVSPVCWYVLAGLPGLVLFKVVSTMDSMVGYKTPRYLRFGWCGARLDDLMNYLPARLTWLVMTVLAALVPGYSGRKAWQIGLTQHGMLSGPNSGWSEAAAAGALERRIVGPIWLKGRLVTDVWVGDPADPPLSSRRDMTRAVILVTLSGLGVAAAGSAMLR